MQVLTNKITTTGTHERYWSERKLDWKEAYFQPFHPHRDKLIGVLKTIKFNSILEIGCGAGANLWRIKKEFPNVLIGGLDINLGALKTAQELLPPDTLLDKMPIDDIFFNDKSTDAILTDACLIYIGPFRIGKVLKEIRRLTKKYVIFVEIHHWNPIIKFLIWRRNGYFVYNYERLLKKHGFRDIQMFSIPKWGDTGWEKYGKIIIARV